MRRRVIQIGKNVFVDSQSIDEPECKRDVDDPASAFAQFLLPRVERGADDASKEVRVSIRAGRSLSDAILDAIETLPENKSRLLRTWVEQAGESRVYAYIRILSRDRGVEHGLRLTKGGPRDEVIANEVVDIYGQRIDKDGVLLEGEDLRRDVEKILFGGYGETARDRAMLKGACVKLRGKG